jgi:O-antigen/teichoic acid export membrane protein
MARGAAWMVLFRLFDRSIGLVSTMLLARLLIPADFGLVAMAMSVIAVIELATAFSFEIPLIQKADPDRKDFDTAWTLNVLIAIGGALLTAALAKPAAAFYGDPRLTAVMLVIGAGWLVSGFENIGTVNFRRNMDFGAEFRFMASKRVIAFVVTISAALAFRSYWALVVGMATSRVAGVILSYAMQAFRPRFSLASMRDLFSFSGWMLVFNVGTVLLGRVPHFFVGRTFGAQTLGAYSVASEIAHLAQTELVAPLNRAMFPGYSRLVGNPELLRRVCTEATAAILLVVLPVTFAIVLFAQPIVRILLGSQWGEAVPIIRILAAAGAVSAVTSNNLAIYLALGRPRSLAIIIAARLLLFLSLVFAVSGRGVSGIAFAELIAALGSLLVSLPMLLRAIELRFVAYLSSLWRPLVASFTSALCVYFLLRTGSEEGTLAVAVGQLLVGLPVGLIVYATLLWSMWRVAGRPETVEAVIGRRLTSAVSGRLARLTRSAE